MDTAAVSRWFAVFRTCIFALLFMGTVGIYLPRYLRLLNGGLHLGWRVAGCPLLFGGALIALLCAFAFAWTGRGTPAPFDPPRRLVVTGIYRYVRNPMYFGMALFLSGEWLLWGSNLRGATIYFVAYLVAVVLFVRLYEEPALRSKFAAEYEEYVKNVPRLLPRLRPWEPAKGKSAASNCN